MVLTKLMLIIDYSWLLLRGGKESIGKEEDETHKVSDVPLLFSLSRPFSPLAPFRSGLSATDTFKFTLGPVLAYGINEICNTEGIGRHPKLDTRGKPATKTSIGIRTPKRVRCTSCKRNQF
jgi:hypothetical protein